MKRKLSVLAFLLLSFLPFSQAQQISFAKGNLAQAKNKAQSDGKLYFAYFYTDWCLPCKWMEDNTFKDAEVVQFVQQNYLAVKLNIDDKEGQNMREQYNVEFLPTIIIFNQSGDILDKFEESLAAGKLLDALKRHRLNMAGASIKLPPLKKAAGTQPAQPQAPATSESKHQPPSYETKSPEAVQTKPDSKPESPIKKNNEVAKIQEVAATTPSPASNTQQNIPDNRPNPPTEMKSDNRTQAKNNAETKPDASAQNADVKPKPAPNTRQSNSYFAVQVGTFTRFENADAKRNEFKEVFGDGVHIKLENTGKDTLYKVMIGRYQTPEAARSLVSLLKEQGIDGFIKEVNLD